MIRTVKPPLRKQDPQSYVKVSNRPMPQTQSQAANDQWGPNPPKLDIDAIRKLMKPVK